MTSASLVQMRSGFGVSGTSLDTFRLGRRWRALDAQAVLGSRPGLRFVELPSSHVRVRVSGRGRETLVFVCDPPNVIEQYDQIVECLAPRYCVVVMEQPGFGFSFPKPGFSFTRAAYAEALLGLLRTLALGPYVLVAPCFSAFYAMISANEGADLVTKLVLMQATSWPEQKVWTNEVAKTLTTFDQAASGRKGNGESHLADGRIGLSPDGPRAPGACIS